MVAWRVPCGRCWGSPVVPCADEMRSASPKVMVASCVARFMRSTPAALVSPNVCPERPASTTPAPSAPWASPAPTATSAAVEPARPTSASRCACADVDAPRADDRRREELLDRVRKNLPQHRQRRRKALARRTHLVHEARRDAMGWSPRDASASSYRRSASRAGSPSCSTRSRTGSSSSSSFDRRTFTSALRSHGSGIAR